MDYSDLEKEGLVEKIKVNIKQVSNNLNKSLKDIKTAKANLKIDVEWSFVIAYHSMLRAGRALMLFSGYRPKGKDIHKTIILFTEKTLGEDFKLLIKTFDRMRKKRHTFIYEPTISITLTEAQEAMKKAEELVNKIIDFILSKDSQMKLFNSEEK